MTLKSEIFFYNYLYHQMQLKILDECNTNCKESLAHKSMQCQLRQHTYFRIPHVENCILKFKLHLYLLGFTYIYLYVYTHIHKFISLCTEKELQQ